MFGVDSKAESKKPTSTDIDFSDRVDLSYLDAPSEPGDLGRMAHYRVLGVLGVGGMGVVLRAEDSHLHRPVALKVMRPEFVGNYTSRERFLQEARAAACLQSDNIVTVYQVGMHNDVPYLAMQYLQGETLDTRMERDPPLSLPDSLLIARQVAAGLACAHANGLVHRDVKPANIWLETDPLARGAMRAKLLDFGLARVIDSVRKLTNMGQILGTPQFMAPEQACGNPADGRADLFSLGSILYALVTGHMPFAAPTVAALLVQIVSLDPVPARELRPDLPREVDQLIGRLLAKAPTNRPETAQDVVDALDEILCEFSLPIAYGASPGSTRIPMPPTTPVLLAPTTRLRGTKFTPHNPDTVPLALAAPASPVAPPPPNRRRGLVVFGVALVAGVAAVTAGLSARPATPDAPPLRGEVRIGVLFAEGGVLSSFERPLADATALAIDDLNAAGGVLGHKVVADADGPAAGRTYAKVAEGMVHDRNLRTVFGTAASSDRRAVLPVIDRANAVLFYAPAFEGMERGVHAVYTGPTAAQQVVPAIDYLVGQGHKRLYVVGSENVNSRATLEVVRHQAGLRGATVVGEYFTAVGERDLTAAADSVVAAEPDLIVNTLRGGSAIALVSRLRAKLAPKRCPVLHLNHLEDFDWAVSPADRSGDYVAGCFLESSAGPEGKRFAAAFRERYGPGRVVTDSVASAYSAVHVWAAAAERAGSVEPGDVIEAVPGLSTRTPLGDLTASANGLLPLPLIVSRYGPEGRLEEVHRAHPEPLMYPAGLPREKWDRRVHAQFFEWGGHWRVEAPR